MKLTVIGSHACPHTLAALNKLMEAGVSVDFKDILGSHADLKAYLALRDSDPLYEDIRGTARIGIPCFIREDGSATLSLGDILP